MKNLISKIDVSVIILIVSLIVVFLKGVTLYSSFLIIPLAIYASVQSYLRFSINKIKLLVKILKLLSKLKSVTERGSKTSC